MTNPSHSLRQEFLDEIRNFWDTVSTSTDPKSRYPRVRYHILNTEIEDLLVRARGRHSNPRSELLSDDPPYPDDLLVVDNGYDTAKYVSPMSNLDNLLKDLRGHIPNLPDELGVVAVALAGGHCARMDGNALAAFNVWSWSEHTYPDYYLHIDFHLHYARILLVLGELTYAREEVTHSLNFSQPHMLQHIEACRQLQLTIDLENVSRDKITEDVTRTATKSINRESKCLIDKTKQQSQSLTEDINKAKDEIKNVLVRVFEILGVFLAVVGIVGTSVGGIAVEGSTGTKIAIWGFGYGAIVLLLFMVLLIVRVSRPKSTNEQQKIQNLTDEVELTEN